MHTLAIFGEASQTTVCETSLSPIDLETNLLKFLQNLQLPIASSCLGEGVCQKCVFSLKNVDLLACELTVNDLYKDDNKVKNNMRQHTVISFSYL